MRVLACRGAASHFFIACVLQPFALITFHERGVAYEARGKHLQTLPRAYQLEGAISTHYEMRTPKNCFRFSDFKSKYQTANYHDKRPDVQKLGLSSLVFSLLQNLCMWLSGCRAINTMCTLSSILIFLSQKRVYRKRHEENIPRTD